MARTRLIPGFDVAPGPNRTLVRKSESGPIVYGVKNPDSQQQRHAQRVLASRRQIAGPLNDIVVNYAAGPIQAESAVSGWRTVKKGLQDCLSSHIERADIPRYKQIFPTAHAAKAHVTEAGNDGIATDVAFLEVISKVLINRDFKNPNDEIAEWARSSVGFIIEWAGLDEEVELQLVWALASPKPRRKKKIFDDLHFNPKWFTDHVQTQSVGLNRDMVPRLRDENNRHPNASRKVGNVLFACPAAKLIIETHKMAIEIAQSNNLFEQTWLVERANHGYPEAWVALDGLRAAARA